MPNLGLMHSGTANNQSHQSHITQFVNGITSIFNGPPGQVQFNPPNHFFGSDNPQTIKQNGQNLANSANAGNLDLIVAAGGSASADSVRGKTIKPIVFTSVSNPNRPAANMTGVCARTSLLDPDRLKLLYQLVPGSQNFGVLINQDRSNSQTVVDALNQTAIAMGYPLPFCFSVTFDPIPANVTAAIGNAFNFFRSMQCAAVLVTADPLFNDFRTDVVNAANNPFIPTLYQWREFCEVPGAHQGLMSYGPNLQTCYRLAGVYAGRILNGGDILKLPVLIPNCELVINQSFAKANNFIFPQQILSQATDVLV